MRCTLGKAGVEYTVKTYPASCGEKDDTTATYSPGSSSTASVAAPALESMYTPPFDEASAKAAVGALRGSRVILPPPCIGGSGAGEVSSGAGATAADAAREVGKSVTLTAGRPPGNGPELSTTATRSRRVVRVGRAKRYLLQ